VSPSWRERVSVFIGRTEVRLRRHAAGLRPVAQPVRSGATLQEVLQGLELARADVQVTLSNDLVRYALVPDADALRNDAERRAAAMHALAQTYGELARGLEVAADSAGYFPSMVAAGVAPELRQGIEQALRAAGAGSVRIQPALSRAMNLAGRRWQLDAGWLAMEDPERIVLAAFAGGDIVALRNLRVRDDARSELQVLLQQSRLLDPVPAETADVLLLGEHVAVEAVPSADGFDWNPVAVDFLAPADAARGRLQLEFASRPRGMQPADAALVGVGALVLGLAAWQYGMLAAERGSLQAAVADAQRFAQRQTTQSLDPNRPDARALAADIARANAVAARLQVPWDLLFSDLESAAGAGVTLTGFEPEGGMRRLRITGEARRFEDVTQYLRQLEAAPGLQNVFLSAHELRDRGLTFTLTADWIRHDAR
jgi:Tfp pilus assembly protein PilN